MYIQSIIDELLTTFLMCKNLTYQLYFTNKDMFHVKHIFYFGILYNTIFHVDILVDYLINNIFYYSNVSRETFQLLLYYFL
jgi:hypothetical protein